MARAAGALGSMLGNMRLPGALLSSGAGSMLSGNKEVGGTAEWMER